MTSFVDITPTARVLRVLGEIPLPAWQCIAEFVDNSLDGFATAQSAGIELGERRIIISWSRSSVGVPESVFEVYDTGPGMELDVLRSCVRAGYTANDPVSSLGLFGMGFNIATAKLGQITTILSATEDSPEWTGVQIDFDELIKSAGFQAPVVTAPKSTAGEHGTRIVVSRMAPGIVSELRNRERQIRATLQRAYSPILASSGVEVMLQNKVLKPRLHCIWGPERYVSQRSGNCPAMIEIDEPLGDSLFNAELNRYLTPDEEADAREEKAKTGALPDGIIVRTKLVRGWLGIQRYCDPDDYGIDFVRNGRKILIASKLLFRYENEYTGTSELEYPLELGTTVGGRIVGEIHIDHVPPNYQKSDFDRSDRSWQEMVDVVRGVGPILPKKRKARGFDDPSTSPLAQLVNAYRRVDAGTRRLMAPNAQAKVWAKKFYAGEAEYETDAKWWEAAKQADKDRADKGAGKASVVDGGDASSDDASSYAPDSGGGTAVGGDTAGDTEPTPPTTPPPGPEPVDSGDLAALTERSERNESLSGEYRYDAPRAGFTVSAWELGDGHIGGKSPGLPCLVQQDGIDVDFVFNPRHSFFMSYPTTPRELLLVHLASRFQVRDGGDIADIFCGLMDRKCPDLRIDAVAIVEKAQAIFNTIREKAVEALPPREQKVIETVHEATGEVEEIMQQLLGNPELLGRFQQGSPGSIDAILFAPPRTLVRLVDAYPEEFFDGRIFRSPYAQIELPDENATARLRAGAKERILSYLRDALWALSDLPNAVGPRQRRKGELARCAHSISFLNEELSG
ncbi:ATP-binding protein [Planctomycetota bacterium]